MFARSRVVTSLAVLSVLAPAVAAALPNADPRPAPGIPGLPGAVGLHEIDLTNVPGDPVRGLAVFRATCGGCHNLRAAGLVGDRKPGSDLDGRKPTYAKVVTLITQGGGGGAPSKQLLQQLTYDQIYDVAKFVALYAGKPGPVKGGTAKPPVPFDLAAPLRNSKSEVAGHFTAKLAGTAFRWRIHVGNATTQPSGGRLLLASRTGERLPAVVLDCERCIDPGGGFVLLTPGQAAALLYGRATIVVAGAELPGGALRGRVVANRSQLESSR
ncbi:MAG TPA: cytochrome c [Gaiellaceae bacterium]|jgi:mono/diheme cytochrome c family protein